LGYKLVNFVIKNWNWMTGRPTIMNWKERGEKRAWPNLKQCLGICLEGPKKTTATLCSLLAYRPIFEPDT